MMWCLYNNLLEGFKFKINLIIFGRKENGFYLLYYVLLNNLVWLLCSI